MLSCFPSPSTSGNEEHRNEVKRAEITLSTLFAEHKVPNTTDMKMHGTKTTNVIKNRVARVEIEEIVDILKGTVFQYWWTKALILVLTSSFAF